MKKVLLFAVIAMFLMVPMSFAKQAISEGDLAGITAQEGVTVDFSCFTLNSITIDAQAWGDSDGCTDCGDYTDEGWVGAIDITMPGITLGGTLTIDVGNDGTNTALIIGLPDITFAGEQIQTIALGTSYDSLTEIMGTSYMSGLDVDFDGALIIYAH